MAHADTSQRRYTAQEALRRFQEIFSDESGSDSDENDPVELN